MLFAALTHGRVAYLVWRSRFSLCVSSILAATALSTALGATPALGSGIYGTLSNFDIYNTTPEPCEGAEIELEGVHASSIGGDYPAHFANRTIVEYTDAFNNFLGSRITYTGYNFPDAPVPGSLLPNPQPTSTNGHALTYTAGGEHFGFWLNGEQPTATRFFWLNDNAGNYERIGSIPESVPGPTWSYVPPANPGGAPIIEAKVEVPEPEIHFQNPDSIWMKVFKTEIRNADNAQDLLERLVSGDPNDPNIIIPQEAAETETEWELLEGGRNNGDADPNGGEMDDKDNEAVLIRYEFYKYTGAYDDEHEPLSNWDGVGDPLDIGERGDFIAANMVAALLVPIPGQGDLNADGVVDIFDVNLVSDHWGEAGPAGDANADGIVDIFDVNLISDNWTIPGGGAAVPEPSSIVLLALFIGVGAIACEVRRLDVRKGP